MAIKVYERMPASSPLKRHAQIQLATILTPRDRAMKRSRFLKAVTLEGFQGYRAIMALGNIERGRKKFADCVQTYYRASMCCRRPMKKTNWIYYYYRGICEERSKQWSKAEADMRKALDLQPSNRMC